MKVLKFGGTSVGSVESILSLKKIVENEARQQPVIVVVSALGGITDKLLLTAQMAQQGNEQYMSEMDGMVMRHHQMVSDVIPGDTRGLLDDLDALFDQLRSIYYGIFLIRDLSDKTRNAIVAYGEQLSSRIVARLVDGAKWYDSTTFIKTERRNGQHRLDAELTQRLVRETWPPYPPEGEFSRSGERGARSENTEQAQTTAPETIQSPHRGLGGPSIVPGFISRDEHTGEVTNLGRGGSDYTAAIIAAALDAEVLEIWTDVDGFMTADPRVIHSAYTIPSLSYVEAMELCNFGAKVIYPPTIYPVCVKNIPIRVKNTFNPDFEGTLIKREIANDGKPIKGISSIGDTALITVSGLSMVGVIGVNRRIFSVLANHGISVFMVSQASSENSTSIAVREADAQKAVEVLNEEFAKEIGTGAMYPMLAETGLATIAIVGENMRNMPGIAGKLFSTLGRSGISVISCAQGAAQRNISCVISGSYLRKALNVLHDSFFLSEYQVLNLFICGIGTVGRKLIEQIKSQAEELKHSRRLLLNVVGIANSRHAIFSRDGISLADYEQQLDRSPRSSNESLCQGIIDMNIFNSVFVDCTASSDVAALYPTLLQHNVSIIAANKIAASSAYQNYLQLKETALLRGVKFRYETNVGAGLPIIGTINDLRNSGDRILRIEAVLSGTLNFIFNKLSASVPFSKAVRMAQEEGYSEPDPRIDLSGIDVVRKLVILTREAGYAIEQDEVEKHLFLPADIMEGSLEDFWQRLPQVDAHFEQERQQMEQTGRRWRFVATMDHGRASVELRQVEANHPFYRLEDSNNIVMLTTERYRQFPMLIQGYGAGASVTAAGVFANIMSIANI